MVDRKKVAILLLVLVIVGYLLIWFIVSSRKSKQTKTFDMQPRSIVTSMPNETNSLQVISIEPKGIVTSVDRFHPVTITFNRSISLENVQYQLTPSGYDLDKKRLDDNTVILTPNTGWDFDQNYTLTIKRSTKAKNGQILQKDFINSFSLKLDEEKLDVTTD